MERYKMSITKELYDEIMTKSNGRGFIPDDMEIAIFGINLVCGYGVYSASAYESEKEGYIISYYLGDSCD